MTCRAIHCSCQVSKVCNSKPGFHCHHQKFKIIFKILMSGKCSIRVFYLRVIIFLDRWLCHNNFCWCCFDLEPFARVVGLVKLPSSNNLQVLQYFWAVVQCSFCNDRWKGKAQQEEKYSWTSPLTMATLGAEESGSCREVAIVDRFK